MKSLRILLTTIHLADLAGSETYTYTIVKGLQGLGHRLSVYSPVLGLMAQRIRELGVPVYDDLEQVRQEPFDVIHAQHNVTALQARAFFPNVPMVFHCHGVLPLPEQPPSLEVNAQRFIAVSEEVQSHLERVGVPRQRIEILRNPIDVRRFRPFEPIRPKPSRALVISNKIDDHTLATIVAACRQLDITVEVIGLKSNPVWDVETYINRADIVFTLGRGALEAMSCARAVFVYDYQGADGWITPETIVEIQKSNFSGRRYQRRLSATELARELSGYHPEMGPSNRKLIEERFSLDGYLPRLIAVYAKASAEFKPAHLVIPGFELRILTNMVRDLASDIEAHRSLLAQLQKDIDVYQEQLSQRETELQRTKQELEALRATFGWRLLERIRPFLERAFPSGSRRAHLLLRFLSIVSRMLNESA